jgi:hypothetical protein
MLNEPGTRRVRVPEGVARLLRDLIHERTGLFFEDTRTDFLIEKLEPAVQIGRFSSFMEYYYALRDNTRESGTARGTRCRYRKRIFGGRCRR